MRTKRAHTFTVLMTDAERAELEELAQHERESAGSVVRALIREKRRTIVRSTEAKPA
jgi:hypothetical protein